MYVETWIEENITNIFDNYKLNIILQYYKKEWFHTNLFLLVLISSWKPPFKENVD